MAREDNPLGSISTTKPRVPSMPMVAMKGFKTRKGNPFRQYRNPLAFKGKIAAPKIPKVSSIGVKPLKGY